MTGKDGMDNDMKILSVDLGVARTGLAVCDSAERLASPVGTITQRATTSS